MSFWSFERVLKVHGKGALLPPLGLVTIAALLPTSWQLSLVDTNLRTLTEDDWNEADLILLSGMIVQSKHLLAIVKEAKARGKTVVVGGPYATSLPDEVAAAGADFLVLDEGERTLPHFLEAFLRGEPGGRFRSHEKPEMSEAPMPRFDLLELDAYIDMAVQYSRGCPFLCEFCDIITLYGRRPRTKPNERLLAELAQLYDLGWRGRVFFVDDNFIGNKKNVLGLLDDLEAWQRERGFPFQLYTEASVDLGTHADLLAKMVRAGFTTVFLGIETPDEESLKLTKKKQNIRSPLTESVAAMMQAGLRVMGGFILGFDGEEQGAGQRIVDFVEEAEIPVAFLSLLQVLPHTGLHQRLTKEGRLTDERADVNQTTLMNFRPTRPVAEIAEEYLQAYQKLYDPVAFYGRASGMYSRIGPWPNFGGAKVGPRQLALLLRQIWRQGLLGPGRRAYWRGLKQVSGQGPQRLVAYVMTCAQIEHFVPFRDEVRRNISAALAELDKQPAARVLEAEPVRQVV